MSLATNLKTARKAAKLTQAALAKLADVSQQLITALETGKQFETSKLPEIAAALNVSIDKLVPRYKAVLALSSASDIINIPLLDSVTAGRLAKPESQIPVEDVPLLAFADLGPGEFFALKVVGSSMDRVSPEGSVIIVNRRDRTLITGKYYVFGLKGETTFKRWHGGDPQYLEPYSIDVSHDPIFLQKKDWECIGRVVRTLLDL